MRTEGARSIGRGLLELGIERRKFIMANTTELNVGAPTQAPEATGQQVQATEPRSGQTAGALQQDPQGGAVQERRRSGIARYATDPFELMERVSDEMDELFSSLLHGRPLARSGGQSRLQNLWAPAVELSEEGNQLRISLDLPGVPRENVKIDVRDGMLTIQGERREERSEGAEQQGFRRSERRYGSFYRAISLPDGADTDNAQAQLKDGVLEVRVPVAVKQPRRLEIQG
jgi:HSP20 family protein